MSLLMPIEVIPELHNKCGVSGPTYTDFVGFDDESLKTVTGQVHAVLFAFPLSPRHEEFRKKQAEENKDKEPKNAYFIKQTLENSCVINAVIHTVANNLTLFSFGPNSTLKEFIDKTGNYTPEERARHLPTFKNLVIDHNTIASETLCRPDGNTHFHVVLFTIVDGHLHEFDGLTDKPIDHGATSEKTFVEDVAKICKQHTDREEGENRFSAVALTTDA
ncbi:ubiquitin carboxyl-terminal hydrolase isozyme L1 isoform X2 [Hyperolius riggenbachi]|uniref:ubiquitin carboxyl-terminal hydrolase isozyme L1 isoform X2 n=1 Tax=Hyperolius riggenbachi TaxID=752182 RepID=UPI0035A29A48